MPRLDKFLWAVRLYKTRGTATLACRSGEVRRATGEKIKPSTEATEGLTLLVKRPGLTRTVRVLQPIERRVGAGLVPKFLEDLTPPEAYQAQREMRASAASGRPAGLGRPSKRDRREIERLLDEGRGEISP